jgi:hypothetical protein
VYCGALRCCTVSAVTVRLLVPSAYAAPAQVQDLIVRSEWQRGTQKTKKRTEGPPGLPPIDRKVLHNVVLHRGRPEHAGN